MTAPPLRVAFCIDNMNPGGTELNALRTAPHLLAAGVDLSVFCLSNNGPLLERYAALGVRVDPLPLRSLYGRSALTAGRAMRQIIKGRGIGIVHAHDFYSNIFAGPWVRSARARFIASRRWWEGPASRAQRWANRASYLLADRIVANAPRIAALLTDQERVPKGRVVVIPNFVDDAAFDPPPTGWVNRIAQDLALPEERVVIGVVANLSAIKDHATLLKAAAALAPAHPSLHVVLVGNDGGSRAGLEHLTRDLGLTARVHFAGHLPNLPSPHHLFDMSVLTSISEGMPNSLIEAMAAGRPVVATAVGAVPDAVVEGETGFLVPPRNPEILGERLAQLIDHTDLRSRFGAAGRMRAEAEHRAPAAVGALLELYRSLSGSGTLSGAQA
ncbi:MAG: glycosyltransferase [Gemmatimonadales bacterium]